MPSALDAGPPVPGQNGHWWSETVSTDRVVAEQRLGAVSVVDVEVDDGDALEPELDLRVPGGDRDVAEDAEAHRRGLERVVPGWANQREAAASSTASDRTPCGKTSRLPGRRRSRTCPDRARPRSMTASIAVDVARGVHTLDPAPRRGLAARRSRESGREAIGGVRRCSGLPLDSGAWRLANAGWLITSTCSASSNLRATPGAPSSTRMSGGRSPNPARRPEAAAAAPRDPSSRCCGRDEALRPRSRSDPSSSIASSDAYCSGAPPPRFSPIPRAPGILSDGSPRSAMKSGTWAGSTP